MRPSHPPRRGPRRCSPLLVRLLARLRGWLHDVLRRWQAQRAAHAQPARVYFEALEPRLLLSADLAAGSLSYSTTSAPIIPGEALSARFTVDRLGDEVPATSLRFYASTDRTLDATDTLLGRRDLAAGTLHPGANPIVVDLDSHAFSSPGRYTLIGVVDPDDRVPESDETNNQALSSSPFEVAFTVGQIPGRSPVPALELTDADGTRFTLAISGPGSASLLPEAGGYRLTVSGNDATTRITLTGSGGDGRLTLSGLEVERALGSLTAPIAVLTGSARFTQINTLSLASIDAGARLQGAALANLTVTGDTRGEVRLSGAGTTGFVLGTAQIGGTLAGLWAIDGRANSVSAQTTAADWRTNFRAPLTQLVVRGDASGQLAAAALQLLQVGGSLRGMTVRIGADLGSDAALGGSGEAADTFRAGTLARLRVTGHVDNSVILVGLDPRNGTDFDGDDQVLGSASAYRIQELLVGGRLTGETRIVAPAFPDSVRVNGALVSPASLSQLSVTAPDRQAPLLSAALANDTGASASDRLTRDPTIAGTLTETGGGRRLWASFATSPSSFVDVSSALLPDGHFVLDAARLATVQGAALPEGAHTLRLVAEDAAGNRSPTVSVDFTLDTTAPAAPGLDLLATSDSGVRDDDELTRDTTPTLRLTAEDGSAIVLRREGDPTPWSLTGPSAEFTSPPLADGAQVFRASATDRAGNVGETATLALAIDSEAPALVHLGLDPDADTGAIGDLQTQAAVIALVGRTAPGTSVRLLDPAKTSTADGTGDFRLADLPLALGDNAFEVVLADAAGNETNGALVVTRLALPTDTTAPTLSAALLADTGASASDDLTNDARFAGTASDDVGVGQLLAQLDPATPDVPFTDVTTLLATDGSFTLTRATLDALAGGTLADGAHTLRFVAVDAAGNRSDVLERQFTLDTAAPAFTGFGLSLSDATNAALDETSAATVQLKGNAEAGATIRLDAQDLEVLAGVGGAFVLPGVALALGANDLTLTASDVAGNTTSFDRTLSRNAAVQADAVLEWNAIARHAVQLDVTDPPVATRTLAMVSLAQYDALAAIEGTPAYLVGRSVSGSVSAPAAVAVAAHRVLSQIYPAQQAVFDGALAADLAALADGPAKDQGIALGLAIADAVLALRAHDGAEDFVAYDGSTALGQWRPTGPMYDVADEPQWATVQPFALRSPDQFRPIAPPALDTAAYAAAVEEVKRLGSATGSERTADQTEQALFWADGKGSYTPPGHWNQIAEEVARNQGNSLAANARLFAQLNVALADAAIAAWDAKYNYGLWRPETAIQNADLDDNDATTVEAAWRPLLITPPHPEYVSGHSTFSAAAAGILAATFGDATAFSTTSATLPGVTRSFTSFTQAAQEAGRSRIYGGIHYEFTNQTGQQLGTQVAEAVLARFALTSDTQAPAIVLDDSPAATNANLTLTGQVLDHLSGVASAQFQVDDGALQALVLDARGGFTIPTAFATDGSADGEHTLALQARDAAGNASSLITRSFKLDTRAPALSLESPTADVPLTGASRLQGVADANGSVLVALSYALDGGTPTPLIFEAASGAFDQPLAIRDLAVGSHTLTLRALDAAGNESTLARSVTVEELAAFTVTETSPIAGAEDVGATYRPQVFFSRAVDAATLTAETFYATDTTGAKLAANIVVGDGGNFAWLFFTNPMPGASVVTVHLAASEIRAAAGGQALDADGDGTPEADFTFRFSTVNLASVPGTILRGKVVDPGPDLEPMSFDDLRRGPDGVPYTADDIDLHPLANVEVFILGRPDLHTFTDGEGFFELTDTPVGDVKVVVNGRTASNAPDGFYFPEMTMDVTLEAGRVNTMMGSMGSREAMAAHEERLQVYLPRLQQAILRSVDNTLRQTITLDPESAPNLTPDQIGRLRLEFQPGSLIGEDGQQLANAQIGISVVPPELVRDMMPPGTTRHGFDITIQAPGVAAFATPLPISFPNDLGLAPGTKANLLSFDHTTGRLEVRGSMTVSEDGTMVVSDPGTGITQPGWHWWLSNSNGSGGPPPPCPPVASSGSPTIRTPSAFFLTGDTGGGITIPDFTLTAPAGSTGSGSPPPPPPRNSYTLSFDGPLMDFVSVTIDGAPYNELSPYQVTLCPGDAPKIVHFTPKLYKDMSAAWGRNFAELTRDQLYGAAVTLRADKDPGTGGPVTSTEETRYIYRWVDVVDANAALAKTGNTAAFLRTNADGVVREKNVDVHLGSFQTTFSPPLLGSWFDFGSAVDSSTRMAKWKFDPPRRGSYSDPFDIWANDPHSGLINVGSITAIGSATDSTTISFNIDDFADELRRVILSLREVIDPGYQPGNPGDDDRDGEVDEPDEYGFPGSNDTREIVYLRQGLNHIYTDDFEPMRVAGGSKQWVLVAQNPGIPTEKEHYFVPSRQFTNLFRDFMPSKRADSGADGILGTTDDEFSSAQLNALDVLINQQALDLMANVGTDFGFLGSAATFAADPLFKDVSSEWKDIPFQFAPSPGFQPIGKATLFDFDRVKMLNLMGTPGRTDPMTRTTFGSDIPQAAQQWALAEYINLQEDDKVTVMIGACLTYYRPVDPLSFGGYLANVFSHEVGHTFGLNEGYLNWGDSPRYGGTANINGNGDATPWNDLMNSGGGNTDLGFQPETRALLEAAAGLPVASATNPDLPLTASLKMWLDNFNLSSNENGRSMALEDVPPVPEIVVNSGGAQYYGWGDESSDFSEVPFGGNTGTAVENTLTIRNIGTAPLHVDSIRLEHGDRGFSIVSAPAGSQTIDAGGTQLVTVQFQPQRTGQSIDRLLIASDSGSVTAFSLNLVGVGIPAAPTADVSIRNSNPGGAAPGSSVTLHGAAIVSNAGHEPLTIAVPNSANVGSAEFVVTGIGPGGGVGPVVLAHGESAEVSFRFSPERAGLRTGTVGLSTNDPDRPTIEIQLAGTGLGSVQSPQWGNDYVAIEFPSQPNTATLRTRSDTSGNFQLWIPPNQAYHEVVFDPETGLVAHGYGRTNDAGVITDLSGTLVFTASTAPDSDFDGLPDDIEFVIGTSSSSPDSDRDGLRDFAEWDMDSDPLDGRSLPAGLLAVTGLQGEAKGVVLAGHTDGARGQIAYVATGTYGLAIVDAPNMLKPVVAGQIELPGDAVDVSLDTRLGLAAVATGGSLEVVDVSNANAPRVARSIPVAAGQVEVVEGVAYVAVGGAIESYSLLTGDRLESVPSGAGDIVGLAADRGVLFAADVGKRLVAVDLSGATMLPVGTIDLPASSGQVFVGGGIAYVGGGASGGFVTVDVSDPSAMLLLSGVDSTAIAGNAIVATGSGDALTLGTSAGAPVLTLADVRDPARTDQLVNSFRLPATAHSLAVGSGLAFVAGGASGLIVVNYRSFDTEGKPPIVSVSAPGADIDPATDGIQVLEGTTLALDIAAQDDRQIARVELLVDGQVAISDVSYPWPGSVVLPTIKDSDDTVSISLRAVDTGGNVGLSDLLEVQLVRDAVAPTLVGSNAPDGAVRGTAFRVLTLEFSEALAAATVTPATVVLSDTAGTVIAAQDIQLRRDGVELQLTYPPLAEGSYQLRLVASEITDRAGNPLGTTDITSAFTIGETHTVEWIGSSSGFWDDPENWSSGVLPGPGDEVVIDVAPGGRIDHRAGATTIRSLTSNGNLQLSGGTLELTGDSSIRGVFTLTGGTLTGAGTLTLAGGGNRWEGGAMTGSGTTRIAAGADLLVTGRLGVLTLAGRTIHNDGTIVVDRGAAGEVVIQPSGAALIRNLGTFEIATQARIGNATHPVAGPRFENPGLLRVRADTVLAVDLDNAGTVDVSAGTRLSLAGAGTGNSSGDFQVAEGATLALPGRQRFESTASASGGGRLDLGSSGRLEIAGGSYDLTVALADGAELSIEAPTTLRFLEMTGGALSGTGPLTLTLPQSELLGGTITVPLIEPPDTVRPMIIESSVSDGATYTLVLGRITLQFSEAMRPESLVPGHFFLLDDAGERIDVLSVAIGTRFRSVTLEVPRLTNGRYRLVVAGDQLEDHRAGNHLADGDWTIAAFRVVLRLFDGALYPTGDGTHSAVLGDVDGDGDLDIVTANTSSASVLLGNGDGTFADRVDYDLPPGSANSVTLGDVDGDGDLDIVTSSSYFYSSSSASVLLGKGDGSFAARVDYALPIGANSVALGDVDGDGDLDIVTSSYYYPSSASVLLGNGDGSFVARVDYALPDGAKSLALGDVDGDGDLDIVTSSFSYHNYYSDSSSASVLLGNGDGSFAARVDYALPRGANSVALGDVDGDGNLDIVTSSSYSSSSSASVLLGHGDGSFAARVDYALPDGAKSLALGDVDGDGDLDIVTSSSSYSSSSASVLLGHGDGSFAARVDYALPLGENSVALGDVDGDGDLDIVTSSSYSSSVLLGHGDGSFVARVDYALPRYAYSVALGDVDGDGDLDIVTSSSYSSSPHSYSSSASVLLGNGDGSFAARVDYAFPRGANSVALGDMDGDGDLDIVTSSTSYSSSSSSASVLLGHGDGSFVARVDYALPYAARSVTLGDVDGDGDLDIVTSSSSSSPHSYSSSTSVLLGNGDGSFAAPVDYALPQGARSVTLGDVDGDGDLDIVTSSSYSYSSSASVLLGNGDGSFAARVDYAFPRGANSVALGDVDGDGDLDIVTSSSYSSSSASVLLGHGDGSFAARVDYALPLGASSVTLGDVDGDGDLDIVMSSSYSASVLLGNGDGTFAEQVDYAAGGAQSVTLGDVDGNGDLDIVTANASSVSVLLNRLR